MALCLSKNTKRLLVVGAALGAGVLAYAFTLRPRDVWSCTLVMHAPHGGRCRLRRVLVLARDVGHAEMRATKELEHAMAARGGIQNALDVTCNQNAIPIDWDALPLCPEGDPP